ncbi:hypothetical protein C923_00435 [Plasmodium falciparum UGT5.1]|uniref:Surface antigen n=1 Tax=Plasmodium falciparum UGT5.1 TaxID=1237627 RepID=W7JUQ8_PLAFA|nr:hypothetical protein C923_00435 [Plasmodium falciparum UGT5.1]
MPELGSVGGSLLYALNAWKTTEIAAATELAKQAGAAQGAIAGNAKGMEVVIESLKTLGVENLFPGISKTVSSTGNYTKVTEFANTIYWKYAGTCTSLKRDFTAPAACNTFEIKLSIKTAGAGTHGHPPQYAIREQLKGLAEKATTNAKAAAEAKSTTVAAEITEQQTA